MELTLTVESDIYEPNIDDNNDYVDYLPPSSKFKNGIRCPCGARKDHVFDSRSSFAIHIKTKTHLKWLSDINLNKLNYYSECEKLKEVVNSQKIIIAKLEKQINTHKQTIVMLAQQMTTKELENSIGDTCTIDLLTFD
jgi:hypothetical protein